MRLLTLTAAVLLLSASGVLAAPAAVTVSIGPDLQRKAADSYGEKEVDALASRLQRQVAKRIGANPAFDDARVELILADAIPTKPTMKQLDDRPGLSYFYSQGAGGATIRGQVVRADGTVTPVKYRYYEDLRWSQVGGTWGDAERVFDRFSSTLRRGDLLASR